MKKFLLLIILAISLTGCSSIWNGSTVSDKMVLVNLKARTKVKDYQILGNVKGEYQRTCVLFGLFCMGDIFVNYDLMEKAVSMGGNEVLDIKTDIENSSLLWYFLFSHSRVKATGIAIKLTQTDTSAKDLYGSD